MADGLEIPLGLEVRGGVALILVNAVISKPYPEYSRPARLVCATPDVKPAAAPKILSSADDLLVGNL